MNFYEIWCDGEPTGMGSTDKTEANAMCLDYSQIYGGKAEIRVTGEESPSNE